MHLHSRAPAIVADGLSRTFGTSTAVDRLDLAIERGEVYGFLGPNGAGKSTTVRMLCTLLAPTAGRAVVAGHDVVERPEQVRLRIGVALQEAALDPRQTGREILRLQGFLYGLDRVETETRVQELAGLIDLGDALDRRVGTYSGGMARRLDLAAALVHQPEVLFLDEPTTGLDPPTRIRVWDEVRRLNDELGMTILLTTQYLEEADELADRVGIIDAGRLVAEGAPSAVKRQVGTDVIVATVEGDANTAARALDRVDGVRAVDARGGELLISVGDGASVIGSVAVALASDDVVVRALTLRTPTLDDVFLELTGGRIQDDGDADVRSDELEEVA